MNTSEIKQHLAAIIDDISESQLQTLLDFASYLKEKSQAEDYWVMQSDSKSYKEWLGPENDIYDQVFKDELEKG